mgnify:CR=1 FL=1
MTAKITTLLTAAALSLTLAAPAAIAQDTDMATQATMLEQAVTNALVRENIDTANVGNLTLNEIVELRELLTAGGEMNANKRQQIELILDGER